MTTTDKNRRARRRRAQPTVNVLLVGGPQAGRRARHWLPVDVMHIPRKVDLMSYDFLDGHERDQEVIADLYKLRRLHFPGGIVFEYATPATWSERQGIEELFAGYELAHAKEDITC